MIGKGGIELYNPLLDDIFGLYSYVPFNFRCEFEFTIASLFPCIQ
jgi:hypothetical protein